MYAGMEELEKEKETAESVAENLTSKVEELEASLEIARLGEFMLCVCMYVCMCVFQG